MPVQQLRQGTPGRLAEAYILQCEDALDNVVGAAVLWFCRYRHLEISGGAYGLRIVPVVE